MSPSSIPVVREVVKHQMDEIYHKVTDRKLRRLAADKLANMGGAEIITKYLMFLNRLGIDKNEDVAELYNSLRSVCWNYSDNSLVLAKKFGESGLILFLIKELQHLSSNYRRSQVRLNEGFSVFA